MSARFPNPMDYLRQLESSTDEPCFECGEWRCRCLITPEDCPGHEGEDNDPTVCRYCGTQADWQGGDEWRWTEPTQGDPLLGRAA